MQQANHIGVFVARPVLVAALSFDTCQIDVDRAEMLVHRRRAEQGVADVEARIVGHQLGAFVDLGQREQKYEQTHEGAENQLDAPFAAIGFCHGRMSVIGGEPDEQSEGNIEKGGVAEATPPFSTTVDGVEDAL